LKCNRFDIEPEITSKILKEGIKIKEIPINYKPRTAKEGKKIKWKDGLSAIWVLVKERFSR
jgi:dolichol-phosphate mannosyltransferase